MSEPLEPATRQMLVKLRKRGHSFRLIARETGIAVTTVYDATRGVKVGRAVKWALKPREGELEPSEAFLNARAVLDAAWKVFEENQTPKHYAVLTKAQKAYNKELRR